MSLADLWFALIAVLWTLYLVLEGVDFGVGMLVPVLAHDEPERQVMFESIGPVWDGNEVWLVVAAGATFAAFPLWYATLFSGFYLPLLLILVLLIVRAVSFEWRGKVERAGWRGLWSWLNFAGALGIPLLWGLLLSTLVHGVPISSDHSYQGNFADLFSAFAVLGAVTLVLLAMLNGAGFTALRTAEPLGGRARDMLAVLSPVALVVGVAYLAWTVTTGVQLGQALAWCLLPAVIAGAALLSATIFGRARRPAAAFASTSIAIAGAVATLFVALYPRLMVSAPNVQNSLTIANSSSSTYTLTVMTVATAILLPVIVLYQLWSYRVFRARLEKREIESPADVMLPKPGKRPAAE
jgi:cytochrome d ubiquinol oxidase subunit II